MYTICANLLLIWKLINVCLYILANNQSVARNKQYLSLFCLSNPLHSLINRPCGIKQYRLSRVFAFLQGCYQVREIGVTFQKEVIGSN